MPQDPAAALSSLLRSASIDDHDEILKAANAAIKANKTDFAAQHTRVVALLKLDRFDDAIRAILEGGVKLDGLCGLEKSYALYKLGKLNDATATLKAVGLSKRSFSHVAAQVAYRLENFDEVSNIYSRLLEAEHGDAALEDNDILINTKAAAAQSEWQGRSLGGQLLQQPPETFELCYNAACAHIARDSLETAATFLQRSIMLCDASEELTDEDKRDEIRPIRAQQGYVYARLGKLKEALEIYQTLETDADSDPDLVAVAKNNLVALQPKHDNPFLVQRQMAASTDAAKSNAKLFKYQSSLLERNTLLVDLDACKVDGVRDRTHKTLTQASQPNVNAAINTVSVVNAAAITKGSTKKEALRSLASLSSKRPTDLGPVLTLVQQQMKQRRVGAAVALLEAFLKRLESSEDVEVQNVRFSPGLVALVVSLMRAQGRQTAAMAQLVKALKHWENRPAKNAVSLLREAGVELVRSSNADDLALAATAFEKLINENKASPIASAGLVASLAATNAAKVQQHIAKLPPVDSLTDGIDVDALVRGGVAQLPRSAAASAGRKRTAADDEQAAGDGSKGLARKRRRRKLPENYVEGKTPDPERWLPLRDRSTYRPNKGKKGKKKAAGADLTQGGVVKDEETLGLVGGGGVKVEKAASSKKKKKGKK